jgi:tetratricopeptide (TPR) repeat protein
MDRNRTLTFGAAFLVFVLALISWFVSASPARCDLAQNLGYAYLAKGTLTPQEAQLRTAQRWFTNPLLVGCLPAPASYGLGQTLSGLGQADAAVASLKDGNDRAELRHFLAGRIDEVRGRPSAAAAEYLQLPHEAAVHFYRLGALAQAAGDLQQALHYFSVSAMIDPTYPKAYYAAAYVQWRKLGNKEDAVESIRRGLAVDKGSSGERDFYQGLLCYYEDDTDCALAAWVSAFQKAPNPDTNNILRYLTYQMVTLALRETPRGPVQLSMLGHGTARQ